MVRRPIVKLALVLSMSLGLTLGTASSAGAGEWCITIGLPSPIRDVHTCIPT